MRRCEFKRHAWLSLCLSGAVLAGAAAVANAAQILADARMSGGSLGLGNYQYTLTLENTAASTSQIGMFWFAWEAGQADFLASEPTAIQTPPEWVSVVEGGHGAGPRLQSCGRPIAYSPARARRAPPGRPEGMERRCAGTGQTAAIPGQTRPRSPAPER